MRVCHLDTCPVGVATQNPQLRGRLPVADASVRVYNYLKVTLEEVKTFARITGHRSVHELCLDDLCTVSGEVAANTGIAHA